MKRYAIGVDLGTTNTVLAYTELANDAPLEVLPVAQLVAPSTVEARPVVPSFLYLAAEHEGGSGAFDLPWSQGRSDAVGELARRRAAEAPARTVSAAKSWLCHDRVDRRAAILPWNAPDDVRRVSPVEASRRTLEHLVAAWNRAWPEAPFAEQRVVLTVPASFDASARELTHEAALGADFPTDFTLLEEPQAAVYAWLGARGDGWRQELAPGDMLLVCDVGGGTTDFTLIRASEEEGELVLERVAVGNHILVGGDNMDLALAHLAAARLAAGGTQVDAWQSVALWHSCRTAKEALLADGGAETHAVSVPGRGSRLVGGTLSTEIARQDVATALLDGFFPHCRLEDRPVRLRASGFQEMGLPYESDPAITRHLAEFLGAHGAAAAPPTHVLFNGGCLKSQALQQRLLEVIGSWFEGGAPVRRLVEHEDLDFAVARGAAAYGLVKEGRGIRIRGGAPRSYYVGIESAGLAVPGVTRPLRALCVLPFGLEEGSELDIPSGEIGLVVGEPASFRFFSSSERAEDAAGTVLTSWREGELVETAALEATLPSQEAADEGYVPVRFRCRLTELGMFELWCVSTLSGHRWKLEFSVREGERAG